MAFAPGKVPLGIEKVRDSHFSVREGILTCSNEASHLLAQPCAAKNSNAVNEAIQPCDGKLNAASKFTRTCVQTIHPTSCKKKATLCTRCSAMRVRRWRNRRDLAPALSSGGEPRTSTPEVQNTFDHLEHSNDRRSCAAWTQVDLGCSGLLDE